MITRWRYCLSVAMLTRWHYYIDAVIITRWRYCLSEAMLLVDGGSRICNQIHLIPRAATWTLLLWNSKWGATPTTLRSSAVALCYAAAEYACPVWERSTHAKKVDATLNETCRMITGCLKPTNTNSLPVLAEIAPSDIRRAVASRTERTRQTTDERHPLNGHLGVVPHLKSWKSFIKSTEPINTTAKAARLELWRERLRSLDASVHLNISADEHLPAGAENPWTTWKALNRLRTQVGRSRVNMLKCGFPKNKKHVTVASGRPCNTYWSAPWWTLPALPMTWQWRTTSPSAVPEIGRARFDEHTTPGGRTS